MEKIKKRKEEGVLDFQNVDIGDETDKDKGKRDKSLQYLHKIIKRNRYFKHLTKTCMKRKGKWVQRLEV